MKQRNAIQRAWNRLRAAMLWARKRRKLVLTVTEMPKYLKCLVGHTTQPSEAHYYCYERELSFDNTPIFRRPSSSTRFRVPCFNFNPQVDFDIEDDYGRQGSLIGGIDERAEEFIAKFYEQMKLQRQISYLQYSETPIN